MRSMKCPQCGFVGWADDERCKKCGVERGSEPAGGSHLSSPGYLQYQGGYGAYSNGDLKKGLAITALVIGIINLFTLGVVGIGAIVGIVVAIVALSKAKRNPQVYGGQGMATAGLVTSILSLLIIVPVLVIAAIAIPNLLAARMAANEASSIATLRTIHAAEMTYQATVGNGKFGTLDQLAADGLIKSELATTGRKNGYRFTVEIKAARYNEPPGFEVVGVPLEYRSTGRRSFFVDETGVIRGGDNRGASATAENQPLNFDRYPSSEPASYSDGPPDYTFEPR
ncbi:MAG TPA: DUF4190 domain-containing protein [Pyrinomonadaceae bacterium]